MSIKVAVNGLGRIGRSILKLIVDEPAFDLVAVNDLADAENLAYLLRFDTVYGRYSKPVAVVGDDLVIGGRTVHALTERDPLALPWKALGVDLVFECTGAHTKREDLEKHIRAGARWVLLSAPSKAEDVETVVHGASVPGTDTRIISCASCTTNCITRSVISRTTSTLNSALNARRSRRSICLLDFIRHLRPEIRASQASTKSSQSQHQLTVYSRGSSPRQSDARERTR